MREIMGCFTRSRRGEGKKGSTQGAGGDVARLCMQMCTRAHTGTEEWLLHAQSFPQHTQTACHM